MADIVPISGGPETAKIRGIIAVPLLALITFGIYGVVWWYKINRELRDLGRKHNTDELGTNPCLSLFAITFGARIIVPAILSIIGTYKRAKRAQQLVGVPPEYGLNPWVYGLLMAFFNIVGYGYFQNELNKVWSTQLTPSPTLPG
jgi:hypothetical protein